MSVPIDLTGQRFGRLVALRQSPERRHGRLAWVCRCDCGSNAIVTGLSLRHGNTKSCGCLNRDKLGHWPERTCDHCGQSYLPRAEGQRLCRRRKCVLAHAAAWKRDHRVPKAGPARPCMICGSVFQPIRPSNVVCRQRDCRLAYKRQLAAERAAGKLRPGNTQIFCVVCGAQVLAAPQTLTCTAKECLLARRRQVDRQTRGSEPSCCIVCGERFWPAERGPGQHYTCSDRCQRTVHQRKCPANWDGPCSCGLSDLLKAVCL